MFELSWSINWLAVLLANLALTALGAAWFMALFAKPYATALGRTDLAGQAQAHLHRGPVRLRRGLDHHQRGADALVRSHLVSSALVFGSITGVGYLASTTFNVAINPNIPRPLFYGVINAPFFVVGNLINCSILAAMQ